MRGCARDRDRSHHQRRTRARRASFASIWRTHRLAAARARGRLLQSRLAWVARTSARGAALDGERLGRTRCSTTRRSSACGSSSSRRTRAAHCSHRRHGLTGTRRVGARAGLAPSRSGTQSVRERGSAGVRAGCTRIRSGVVRRAGSTRPASRTRCESRSPQRSSQRRALSCSSASISSTPQQRASSTLGARHASHLLAGAAETCPGVAPRVCESGTGARDGRALVEAQLAAGEPRRIGIAAAARARAGTSCNASWTKRSCRARRCPGAPRRRGPITWARRRRSPTMRSCAARAVLALLAGRIELADLSRVLRSPFIAGASACAPQTSAVRRMAAPRGLARARLRTAPATSPRSRSRAAAGRRRAPRSIRARAYGAAAAGRALSRGCLGDGHGPLSAGLRLAR